MRNLTKLLTITTVTVVALLSSTKDSYSTTIAPLPSNQPIALDPNEWQAFYFPAVGEPALNTFTFDAPPTGAKLYVTDAGSSGDRFNIFNNGNFIGNTPSVSKGFSCGFNPDNCFNSPFISHGIFDIKSSGKQNIEVTTIASAIPKSGGLGYLKAVTSDTPYYKLSTYEIPIGDQIGLKPVAKAVLDILVPFTTPPDSKNIYADTTGITYVLNTEKNSKGIATLEDLKTIPKLDQPISSSDTAKSILDNSLKSFKESIITIDKIAVNASFSAKGKNIGDVPLANLSKAMGYSAFNWLQIVTQVPPNTDWYTGTGLKVVDNGEIINTETGKFFDPLFKGNLIHKHGDTSESGLLPTDTKDFYFDIPGFGDGKVPYKLAINSKPESSILLYSDSPLMPSNPGIPLKFITKLVGIKEGDDSYNTYEEIPGFNFNWQSTFRCANDKCDEKVGEANYFISTSSLGLNLSDLYSSLGLTAADFTGGVTILDDNGNVSSPTSVPEPCTIIGTLIGGTVAFRLRKKLKAVAD